MPQVYKVYLLICQIRGSHQKVPILKAAIKTNQNSSNFRNQKTLRSETWVIDGFQD